MKLLTSVLVGGILLLSNQALAMGQKRPVLVGHLEGRTGKLTEYRDTAVVYRSEHCALINDRDEKMIRFYDAEGPVQEPDGGLSRGDYFFSYDGPVWADDVKPNTVLYSNGFQGNYEAVKPIPAPFPNFYCGSLGDLFTWGTEVDQTFLRISPDRAEIAMKYRCHPLANLKPFRMARAVCEFPPAE